MKPGEKKRKEGKKEKREKQNMDIHPLAHDMDVRESERGRIERKEKMEKAKS